MPVLKTYKNGVWEPVSGMSEHTHTKNDITDLEGVTVYTQSEEPLNAPDGAVWVDTDEEVGFGSSGGGSASIDVTAEVGQTIVVEEVDANGKPTKWKSADYQPRTHWTEETVILPETTVECVEWDMDEDGTPDGIFAGALPEATLLNDNTNYTVVYNGTKYSCKSVIFEDDEFVRSVTIGNLGALGVGIQTGEPFMIIYAYHRDEGYGETQLVALDGSTTVTLSITEVKHTPIPVEYMNNVFPYYIEVTGSGEDDDPYVCTDTVENVEAIYKSGRPIGLKTRYYSFSNDSTHGYMDAFYSLVACTSASLDGTSNMGYSPYGMGFIFSTVMIGNGNNVAGTTLHLTPQEDGTYAVSTGLGM